MMKTPSQAIQQTKFGPAAPSLGWVPAPRYILRRSRILRHLRDVPRGRLLEIGCGSGALLSELAEIGFECTGLETSEQAVELAKQFNATHPCVTIQKEPDIAWHERFDYVLACEVLEHIEDDESALRQWASWLRPGSTLLLSVPAHQRLWSDDDVWAGHYRRYSRHGLAALCHRVGLNVADVESYGYPLANWVDPLRARIHGRSLRRRVTGAGKPEENTARSGAERPTEVRMFPIFGHLPGALIMQTFCQLQRVFLRTDLGSGYLVVARHIA